MRKRSETFEIAVLGCVAALALALHSIYEDLVKALVIKWFGGLLGMQEAEVMGRLTEMAIPLVVSVAVVWFTYQYIKGQLALEVPDPAIEAQKQHTAAILAQTEAWKSTASDDLNVVPVPNIRVADNPIALNLFDGTGRDKLFPLLEAGKLIAWARPMGAGEPPPIRLEGDIWRSHFFEHRSAHGQSIPQTFVKERSGGRPSYYDVFLNLEQCMRFWPDFALTDGVPADVLSKAKLIADARSLVAQATAKKGIDTNFLKALERSLVYFQLRPYLSERFKNSSGGRVVFVAADGSNLPALARMFLAEIDRLEKEWGVGGYSPTRLRIICGLSKFFSVICLRCLTMSNRLTRIYLATRIVSLNFTLAAVSRWRPIVRPSCPKMATHLHAIGQ
jgi:hypothetical protein